MGAAERAIRVGTRGSALALWQTDHAIARLREVWPDVAVERVTFTTTGDRRLDRPLAEIGDKGLFTAELEAALHGGDIDLAVHSLKDLPTQVPAGLAIGAVLTREDPRDALLSLRGLTLDQLPAGAVLGTSSLRRRAQVLARRPDLRIRDMRGNVPTRVDALVRGDYDAILLAHAGLKRLGLTGHVSQLLPAEDLLPAVGQGAIALQSREGDPRLRDVLARLDHRPTRLAVTAERALLAAVEGGCQIPLGALADADGPSMTLRAIVADLDGRHVVRDTLTAAVIDETTARQLGRVVADLLISRGAGAILERIRAAAPPSGVPRS
jgi:hydroxymethylbilane synthase